MEYTVEVVLEVFDGSITSYYTGGYTYACLSEEQKDAKRFFSLNFLREEVVPNLKRYLRSLGCVHFTIQVVGVSYLHTTIHKF